MNNDSPFLKMVKKRRCIRRFIDKPLMEDDIKKLCKTLLWSPSSRNFSSWEFILVRDRDMLKKLSCAKKGAWFLEEAALGIVVLGDENKSDVWVEDTSIAAVLLMFQALDLGLGACWAQIRNREFGGGITSEKYVQGLLKIPGNLHVEAIIGIGYSNEKKEPHKNDELDWSKIHAEEFGRRYF